MKHTALLKPLKKGIFLAAAALLMGAPVFAQPAIFTNAIFGSNPGFVSPFTAGQSTNIGISSTGISRGSGLIGGPGDDVYNAANFTTSFTPDPTDYFEFTITPNTGNFINFSQFSFTLQRDLLGPTGISLRSSRDGFAGDIGAVFATTTGFVNNISLTAAQFQNVNTAITFRIYGYASNGLGAQLSVNDFTFYGAVSSTPLSNNLLAFDARTASSDVQLSWKTTCGSDARSFTVEKSVGGKDFTAVGTIDAGSGACGDEGRAYTMAVPAEAGRTIYRLAMRDASGYLEYSRSVALVTSKASVAGEVSVFPSVATNSVMLRGAQEGDACRIVDLTGRTLQSWKAAGGQEAVSVSQLPAGAYILVAESASGPAAQRFWKQ